MNRPFGSDQLENRRVAVFFDFENIKRSVDDYFMNERVDLKRILDEISRISQGRILIKRAYADWSSFKDYRSDLLENATEPVQAFPLTNKGKNGADIRMAIDVIECVLRQPEISHVALVSGDSDFTPLVTKLRELGRYVIGVGARANTSTYLAKSCDRFLYYDDLRELGEGASRGYYSVSSSSIDPGRLVGLALAALGNRPVPGSTLKIQMRKIDPQFDELRLGFASFLDFLRSQGNLIDIYKPAVGDVTVAPYGQLIESEPPQTESLVHFASASQSLSDRYRYWLRENNFRYVAPQERQQIIAVLFDIFVRAEEGEGITLKEAKDQLHAWFEEHQPAVPWDSINSTVYHLFYTWCFAFEKSEESEAKQLWDRNTTLVLEVESVQDLIDRVERGIIRKLWERDRTELDPEALNDWLYDGNIATLDRIKGLIEAVGVSPAISITRPNLG